MRILIGFCLGVLSQEPGFTEVANDFGAWTRCIITDCQK